MSVEELTSTGSAVCAWMQKHGYPEPADWLAERIKRISASASASERDRIKREIHDAIPGMGGLGDLAPRGVTPVDREEARLEFRQLVEVLYSLTES